MSKTARSVFLLFMAWLSLPAHGAQHILAAKDARLTGPSIRMQDGHLAFWKAGESAEWTFSTSEEADSFLVIAYAAPSDQTIDAWVDGEKRFTCPLPATKDWFMFEDVLPGKIHLQPGEHTLRLTVPSGEGYCINLKQAEFTPKKPQPFSYEYPSVYSRQDSWAETMVAMRAAFLRPEIEQATWRYGKQLTLSLSTKDGKALWTDFPQQSDWFLQDNPIHGEWGNGGYDARKDYKHYLDPDRDSLLEQKLIEHVLKEIDAPDLQKQLNRLTTGPVSPNDPAWLALYETACRERRTQRLAPLLKETRQLIYATHMNMGTIYLATETQGCPDGSQLRIIDLAPEAGGNPLRDELLFDSGNGIVRDPELSFDGKKLLFAWRKTNQNLSTNGRLAPETGNYKIYEMDLASRKIRPLTDDKTYGADIEPCCLPDGNIMFSSMRCVQEVTCGWGDCSNLYIMDKDGKYARRVGFDQTQTAFPHLLNDGRVIYTRRDYNDRGQSYAHALFVMNPDGTFQTEYYGNNSMAPTSIQHTRPIPGSKKTMGVAGGYHTTQGGKLVVIDPSRGRQNYDGLTFFNWTPTPPHEVNNENYCRVGEQYTYPYPFDENSLLVSFSPIGAYLTGSSGALNASKEQGLMLYHLYYMTLDGRRELLAAHPALSCTQAIPVRPRSRPPLRASSVDYTKDSGTCYVQNVYYGPSAEGIEPGSIRKLRVIQLHCKPATIGAGGWSPPRDQVGPGRKYAGYGWHSVLPAGVGSASFDTKTILGEAEVHADGSAMFEVPARTPIYFQLIDENGLAAQTMRSWATLMPNENFSCVGCHEENDSAPLPGSNRTAALQRPPQKLQPVYDFSGKPFSYPQQVQPLWDQHCIACHAPGKKGEKIDLTGTLISDNPEDRGVFSTRRKFNRSYLTLLQVNRVEHARLQTPRLDEGRPNQWVDYYTRMATMELTPPYHSGSTQSGLIQLLLQGHGKTRLTPGEIATVAAWIDLNVPYVGEYDEMNIWDDAAKELYRSKMQMRRKQEAIEIENIKTFIQNSPL
jgi:hypothetical protein